MSDNQGKTQNDMPKHIAIIMDGNGRWAKQQGKIRTFGHRFGVDTVKKIITLCDDMGIKYLTLYTFSTENWKRPEQEVSFLMNLITDYLAEETPELVKKNVVMNFIGDISALPEKSLASVKDTIEKTKDNTGLIVNIALNYGGRSEILLAAKRWAESLKENGKDAYLPTEEEFEKYLYTAGQPDPDLIIRTGGEIRLSNFLLWQAAYSELYFTDVLWPDFDKKDLEEAINYYKNRQRRYGGLVK